MPDISRRMLLKVLLGASMVLAATPMLTLSRFLNVPYTFTPVKASIEGASSLPKNSSLVFLWPTQTRPFDTNILIRDPKGDYLAFNRVCTHLQCLVNYDQSSQTIVCPCHGSVYDAKTGAVVSGPAPRALPTIKVEVGPDGTVYAVDADGSFGYGRTKG